MRNRNCGVSIQGTFVGTAVHADDIRCIAPNIDSISSQSLEIQHFTNEVGMKLNPTKLEIVRMSQTPTDSIQVEIGENQITTSKSARCLGVQWRRDLSANDINISKARRAFFRLGSTGAFHGKLNPLSASSIFETCIGPLVK